MNRKDRWLREQLRAHDPAREDEGLSPVDRARIRQTLLDAARDRPERAGPIPAAAAAGLGFAVLAFLVAFLVMTQSGRVPPRPAPDSPVAAGSAGSPSGPAPARQIQMTTPGGTRIVWILKS